MDPALREALRRARPRRRRRGPHVRRRGEGRRVPDRRARVRAARGEGELVDTLTTPQAMQAWTDAERRAGKRVALVPTMGALHDGHLRLVDAARRHADRVVVSIFVNPMQFNRRDDFERYPRPIDDDLARCAEAGVDAVYAPNAAAMYPEG